MGAFDKFNEKVDIEGLQRDIQEAEENGGGDYKKVLHGKYEVKIEKIECKMSKDGTKPLVNIWFKILDGDCKGQIIFYTQCIHTGPLINMFKGFLSSLDSGVEIVFEDYPQFEVLMEEIVDAIEQEGLEYVLNYGENDKGFNTFKIEDIFTN